MSGFNAMGGASGAMQRGQLARLVMNPDPTPASPPFALADQAGAIQRYVEPVPGIDLGAYIDQVVVVRHDTGHTLLASQLELPPRPLYPLLGDESGELESRPRASQAIGGWLDNESHVRPAQFADDDDATVQLLPDGEDLPDGARKGAGSRLLKDDAAQDNLAPEAEYFGESGPSDMDVAPSGFDFQYGDPHLSGPFHPGLGEGQGCPKCGQLHFSTECGPAFNGPGAGFGPKQPQLCRYYANAEINFLRAHVLETPNDKLSEKYEPSPRVTVGFNETGKLDGRVRYWHYSQDTPILGGDRLEVEFDVLDLEATHLIAARPFEVLMGGGLRLAGIELTDAAGDATGADLLGMTFFAEGRNLLCSFHDGRIAWVFGGRLSILGGDWGGDVGNSFTGRPVQDDNVVVHELHAGIVYAVRYPEFDLHARLGFEMQNWHSDALSQNSGRDSIGFLGPGIQVGAGF
jgi:hypothetical protein